MKNKLTTTEKALIAAKALHGAVSGELSDDDIAKYLRTKLGLGWTLVAAAQYLTGKAAVDAVDSLPSYFAADGLTKDEIVKVVISAHSICANASLSGNSMSGSLAVRNFKDK